MIDRLALLNAAIRFHLAGITPIPVRTDGSKAPGLSTWKQYQDEHPKGSVIAEWFDVVKATTDGIGVLTGATSNLEMLEFEGRAIVENTWGEFVEMCEDNGAGDLLWRIRDGYTESTPSGGIHLLYRLSDGVPRPNTKLASRPVTEAERAESPQRVRVLIETRGEGGFVVVAPSAGRSHPTGGAWTLTSGGIDTIATITVAERDQLHLIANMLDQAPVRGSSERERSTGTVGSDVGDRPGDDWAAKTDWAEILEPHGWTLAYTSGRGRAWFRPGKTRGSISATTGTRGDSDNLYVFSTSTDLPTEEPLSKFWIYAHYHHNTTTEGLKAAARALGKAGYGTPATQRTDLDPRGVSASWLPPLTGPKPVTLGLGDRLDEQFRKALDHPLDHDLLTGTPTSATIEALADEVARATDPELWAVRGGMTGTPLGISAIVDAPATTLSKSEDGHSQALIAEHGAWLRYCPESGRWLHWDGWRWATQPAGGGIAREYAKAVARGLPDGDDWKTHKKRSLSAAGVSACLQHSQTDHRVTVALGELDARPWELNTPGGIVDLRTGTLGPALPGHLHTRSTVATPDPDADLGPWLAFLDTTFQGDEDLIGFVQRLMGYACVGVVREAILPVCYGAGANGKTVLLETVQRLLGDYATTVGGKFLVQGPPQHPTEIAKLAGIRFVVASETNEGERFDEAKVKLLSGGDRLSARFMRQDEFTFIPQHLIALMTNHRLEVSSGGPAFWRRVREVPFLHVVPEGERDPELSARLIAEHGPAIMGWLVRGAALYHRDGLREPDGVRRATAEYEASTDTVAQFVEDMLIVGGGELVKMQSSEIRAAYETWCRTEGETPVPPKALTTRLTAGWPITMHKGTRGIRYLTGVTLARATPEIPRLDRYTQEELS